jgi:hypothetical protein
MLNRAIRRHGVLLVALCALGMLFGGCSGASGGGSDVRPPDVQPNATVPPSQDVSIAEDQPTTNFNTNTASCSTCQLSLTVMSSSNQSERRALLKYDLSSLPVGQGQTLTIVGADLHLEYLDGTVPSTDDEVTIYAYRCTQNWSEGAVTWNNQPSHTGASIGSVLVKGTRFDCYLPLNPATVQSWFDAPATNYGLVLMGTGSNGTDSCKAMASKEHSGKGITLDVSYTVN